MRSSDMTFRQRRLRIAKLTHFFGVGYEEIKPSILIMETESCGATVHVDIKSSSRRYWPFNEAKETEGIDVAARLRELRTA
jgi:hypothetical protein